jgi:hypothetical protein
MAVLSVVLADICIFDAEFPVDRDRKPVQGSHHFRGILFIHGARLVPDNPLAELFDQFLHFGAGKLLRDHKFVQVIGRTKKSLGRGQAEVFGEKNQVYHKTVSEFTGHTHGLSQQMRKR